LFLSFVEILDHCGPWRDIVVRVEIDDQELWEEETDAGGTLMLALPEGTDAGVRIRRRAD
jgi:hypothetical protein